MSIPNPFRPVCGPAGGELPYIQPQYKEDLSGYVVEPSVPTLITRTGWSGDPTDTNSYNPRHAFRDRNTPVSYILGNSWYANGQKIVLEFGKPVKVASVGVLPIQHFASRYMKGFDVLVDGTLAGGLHDLIEENPVTRKNLAIANPKYCVKLEIVFDTDICGITQIYINGTYKQ